MNCRELIYQRMKSLHLYRFPKEKMTLVQCELESYLCVLEQLQEQIEKIYSDSVLEDCSEQRLEEFERLMAIPISPKIPIEKRRKIAQSKWSIAPSDYHREGLERALRALGIRAEVKEKPGSGNIIVTAKEMANSDMTLDEAKQVFRALMPAHLEAEFVTGGICFAEFDSMDKSCAEIDEMDKSWSQLEMMGKEEWVGGERKVAKQL